MNTSLLYHAFGIQHQNVLKCEYKYGKIAVKIKTKDSKLQCSKYKSYNVIKSGKVEGLFRTIPIGKKQVFMHAIIQRLECKACARNNLSGLKYNGVSYLLPLNM